MPITRKEVEYVAHLSRLELTEEEMRRLGGQLDSILGYMDKLNELDTTGVEPMVYAIQAQPLVRQDLTGASLPRKEALQNAPESDQGCFKVPRIIE
jgi:aspartyl-tRNA(Asn)/glutamyl-tRNA(Gln) amidotransferase subunit C